MAAGRDGMSERLTGVDGRVWGAHARGMDVLTSVLETTQVRGVLLSDFRYPVPFGVEMTAPDVAGFHLVMEGACVLRARGRAPLRLLQGDLVLVPSATPHAIADSAGSSLESIEQFIARGARPCTKAHATRVVCGAYRYVRGMPNPLMALLPPIIHIPARDVQRDEALAATLRLLAAELDRRGPGSAGLVDRLVDALFIYVVRAWVADQPEGRGGWLGALRDEKIGRALGLLHQAPSFRWTLERLAAEVGLSRAAFARRFNELVGMPPLTYATQWRLELAARRLRTSDATLAEIAAEIGYESEFAFSRAFKRVVGSAPGAFRTTGAGLCTDARPRAGGSEAGAAGRP